MSVDWHLNLSCVYISVKPSHLTHLMNYIIDQSHHAILKKNNKHIGWPISMIRLLWQGGGILLIIFFFCKNNGFFFAKPQYLTLKHFYPELVIFFLFFGLFVFCCFFWQNPPPTDISLMVHPLYCSHLFSINLYDNQTEYSLYILLIGH